MKARSLLHQANKMIEDQNWSDSYKLFKYLASINPNFLPYKIGLNFLESKLASNLFSVKEDFSIEVSHPKSNKISQCNDRQFFVVTPCLNSISYIQKTIESVIGQQGNFFIDYLIMDSCSNDGTIEKIVEFAESIANGSFNLRCNGLSFRLISRRDAGMYDALYSAFNIDCIYDTPNTIQTYINSDDLLVDNALSVVSNIFNKTPTAWLTGKLNVIDWCGRTINSSDYPLPFSNHDIRQGLHDGSRLYTVQQEGTFWLRNLYKRTDGFDRRLKLAGDFDLWIKFAEFSELLSVDRPLGAFRSHANQLSKNKDQYTKEIQWIMEHVDDSCVEDLNNDKPVYILNQKSPPAADLQSLAPICFLNENLDINEIVYLKRCWYGY